MPSAVVFGSAITSARFNGATIFFRGICRSLVRAGWRTVFAEEAREIPPDGQVPPGVEIERYADTHGVRSILEAIPPPRLILKFVLCGSMDAALEETILSCRQPSDVALFVDGDAPITLGYIRGSPDHHLRFTLSRFDGVLILAGGEAAAAEYRAIGARRVRWGYCAVDEEFWRPVPPDPALRADLLFVANRLPDRDQRVGEFFLRPATLCPDRRLLLAGVDWGEVDLPPNVHLLGHLAADGLRRAYSSARLVLNVNRAPMARYGYSPASRLFEAAACSACMLSDYWPGIEELFAPGQEILVAQDQRDIVAALSEVAPTVARQLGLAARRRVQQDYTSDRWVRDLLVTLTRWGLGKLP